MAARSADGRRQRHADRAARPPMGSEGRPGVNQLGVQREFWKRIAEGMQSEDAAGDVGMSSAVGCSWFREAGGMPSSDASPRAATSRSPNARSSPSFTPKATASARSLAGWAGTLDDLSRAAPQRGHTGLPCRIGRRRRIGMLSGERRPKVSKLAANDRLREYVQDRLAGRSPDPMVSRDGTERAVGADVTAVERTGGGAWRGAPSRSPLGYGSSSLMMRTCGSLTRRSIKRSMSRAGVR